MVIWPARRCNQVRRNGVFAMTYAEQLQQPQWKAKRLEILKRDGFKCVECGTDKRLHVHHKKYLKGKSAWDVPNEYLVTLCEKHHADQHRGKDISLFIKKKSKPKKKKVKTSTEKVKERFMAGKYKSYESYQTALKTAKSVDARMARMAKKARRDL